MPGHTTPNQSQMAGGYIRNFFHITQYQNYLIQVLFCCQALAERPPPELNSRMCNLIRLCEFFRHYIPSPPLSVPHTIMFRLVVSSHPISAPPSTTHSTASDSEDGGNGDDDASATDNEPVAHHTRSKKRKLEARRNEDEPIATRTRSQYKRKYEDRDGNSHQNRPSKRPC